MNELGAGKTMIRAISIRSLVILSNSVRTSAFLGSGSFPLIMSPQRGASGPEILMTATPALPDAEESAKIVSLVVPVIVSVIVFFEFSTSNK
ncbi:MAG: hypothetical protein V3S07_02665 [Micropepsaceae bacterium]